MTPDQEKLLRATADCRLWKEGPNVDIAAIIAAVVLELAAKVDNPPYSIPSLEEQQAAGFDVRTVRTDRHSLRPLRERLEQYLAEYHYSQPKGYFSETQIVDGILDILENAPPPIRLALQYTDEQKDLLDVKQIQNCYRAVIQAIRRGE